MKNLLFSIFFILIQQNIVYSNCGCNPQGEIRTSQFQESDNITVLEESVHCLLTPNGCNTLIIDQINGASDLITLERRWVINGLNNSIIKFEGDVGLQLQANGPYDTGEQHAVIEILNSSHLDVLGNSTSIEYTHTYPGDVTHEWRHNFYLNRVQDVTIDNFELTNTDGGDGIYIGGVAPDINETVTFSNITIHRALRNGIAIVHGNDITVENCTINNIDNTNHRRAFAGIDVETHQWTENISNVTISNVCFDNVEVAVWIGPTMSNNHIGICTVEDLSISNSENGVRVSDCRSSQGTIIFRDIIMSNVGTGFFHFARNTCSGMEILIENFHLLIVEQDDGEYIADHPTLFRVAALNEQNANQQCDGPPSDGQCPAIISVTNASVTNCTNGPLWAPGLCVGNELFHDPTNVLYFHDEDLEVLVNNQNLIACTGFDFIDNPDLFEITQVSENKFQIVKSDHLIHDSSFKVDLLYSNDDGFTWHVVNGNTFIANEVGKYCFKPRLSAEFSKCTSSFMLGCTQQCEFVSYIEEPECPLEEEFTGIVTNAYGPNGSIQLVNTSNNCSYSSFSYKWDNGETTKSITDLIPADYCVTITASNGDCQDCEVELCFTVYGSSCYMERRISKEIGDSWDCKDNGYIRLGAFAPKDCSPSYDYVWDNDLTGNFIQNLSPGKYCATVASSDCPDCFYSQCFYIKSNNSNIDLDYCKKDICFYSERVEGIDNLSLFSPGEINVTLPANLVGRWDDNMSSNPKRTGITSPGTYCYTVNGAFQQTCPEQLCIEIGSFITQEESGRDCPEWECTEEHLKSRNRNINKVDITPNPSNGQLYWEISSSTKSLELYDLNGRKIRDLNPNTGQTDISSLQNGIYLIRIVSQNNEIQTHKVIKI